MTQQTFTDHDAKIVISGIINEIWGGAVSSNTPDNINQDVIDVVNDTVESIKTCSKRLLATDVTYNFLYTAPGTIWDVILGMAADLIANGIDPHSGHNPLNTYVGWFNVLKGNRQYKACVNVAAANNRSRLEMAFLGI